MKLGLLYSGQGTQYHGMGKELYECYPVFAKTVEEASAALGWDMKKLLFDKESKLNQTEFTQPAVLTVSVGIHRILAELGVKPEMVAGLSLGEYSALVASGALDFKETVALVQKRGRWMTEAVPEGEGGMSAVINISREKVEAACLAVRDVGLVVPANYNCPDQIVISGEIKALEKVEKLLSIEERSKVIRLNVSGPFHTDLLEPAAIKLACALDELNILPMTIPVVTNTSGKLYPCEKEIPSLLTKQVKSPVYWEECVETMINEGIDTFIEIGPGKALKGFVKKINRKVAVEHIEDLATLEKVLKKYHLPMEVSQVGK